VKPVFQRDALTNCAALCSHRRPLCSHLCESLTSSLRALTLPSPLPQDVLTDTSSTGSASSSDCSCSSGNMVTDPESGLCGCDRGYFYDVTANRCTICAVDTYSDHRLPPTNTFDPNTFEATILADDLCLACADLDPYSTTLSVTGANSSAMCLCQEANMQVRRHKARHALM